MAIDDGFRESEQSWHELLVRLRDQNGLVLDPELATGDGALGFWKAARKVWPTVRAQRCWSIRRNLLNHPPKHVQPQIKAEFNAMHQAERRAVPRRPSMARWQVRCQYDEAADCLARTGRRLLTFCDFPPEHWRHVRTTDEIDKCFVSAGAMMSSHGRPRGKERGGGWEPRRAA